MAITVVGNTMKSIHKYAFALILTLLLSPCVQHQTASAEPGIVKSGSGEVTELWQGKVLTAKFRAGMCFAQNGKARGVLLLTHANGQTDTYHLYGTIKNNEFNLSHGSGHVFTGKITGKNSMEGKVRLKGGMSLNLKGARTIDAPLQAEDCAPLPQ